MAILSNILRTVTGRDYPRGNPALVARYSNEPGYVIDPPVRRGLGVDVRDDAATTITAVYRAVQLIASTIASLPLHVYERRGEDRVRVQDAASALLWRRPNAEVASVVFWETVIGHEVLNGNAYLFVESNQNGVPWQLWPIEPRRVTVHRDEDGVKYYVIDGGDTLYRDYLRGGDIIHVTGFGTDGLVGISPIKQMALTLGLAKTSEEYAARFFANGTTLSGVLQSDQSLTKEQAEAIGANWARARSGMNNSHRPAVLDKGLKWQPTSINPEDAQMLATRQFQVAEVARMFGIPENLLGSHDKTSSWGSGLEVQNRAFLQYTLLPHIVRFEQTITDELLQGDRYIKFETGGLMRGTNAERAAFYNVMRQLGAYTVNDILALEDRATIGPEGDTRLQPLNMGQLGESSDMPAGMPLNP